MRNEMRASRRWRLALAALLLLPLVEIVVIVAVGTQLGVLATLGLLVLGAVLGVLVMRREGARAFRSARDAARSGRAPGPELSDRAMVFVSGLLLLLPGFVTDAVAALLWLPPVRRVVRRAVGGWAVRHAPAMPYGRPGASPYADGPHPPAGGRGPDVVAGEVVD